VSGAAYETSLETTQESSDEDKHAK